MKTYLAGGAVRDLLLGRTISDRDYLVTDTTREAFISTFPTAREVGIAFPVFLLDGIEFSFPRASSLTQELFSRDLTVNALLLDTSGNLTCHPDGLSDLHKRILRPASESSFYDDPLRVFRAARFWAQLPDFTPHDSLLESMRRVSRKGLLPTVAPDRIGQETRKALKGSAPGNYLRLLEQADCLSPWFEEFAEGGNKPAGPLPYHDTDVLEHTCRVMDALAGDEIAVWMGLCHDLGKTSTPEKELPRHFGHDNAGQPMAERLARRIKLPNKHVKAGGKAAKWHMIAAKYRELRPGTKVDMLMDLHLSKIMKETFTLVWADHDLDHYTRAEKDLRFILPIKLSPDEMNLGAESGKRLRQLRAQKIAKRRK